MELLKDSPAVSEVRTLKIEFQGGKSNFIEILRNINDQALLIPLFSTVEVIKIYRAELGENIELTRFLLNFRALKQLKGITTTEFNPLEVFS